MSIIDEIRSRVPDSWWEVHGPAIEAAHAKERAAMDEHLRDAMAICERRWNMIQHLAPFLPRTDPQWQAIQDELDSGGGGTAIQESPNDRRPVRLFVGAKVRRRDEANGFVVDHQPYGNNATGSLEYAVKWVGCRTYHTVDGFFLSTKEPCDWDIVEVLNPEDEPKE